MQKLEIDDPAGKWAAERAWRTSFMRRKPGTAWRLGAAAIAVMAAACGPSLTPAYTPEPGDPVVASDVLESDRAAPFSESPSAIPNGSFEQKDETGRPLGWAVSPASSIVRDVAESYAAIDGNTFVALESTGESWTVLAANVVGSIGGGVLVATAQGRAPIDSFMFLEIGARTDGEFTTWTRTGWPACPDDWTPVVAKTAIDPGASAESIQVRVIVRNEPGRIVYVDDVRVTVLPDPRTNGAQ